MPDLFDAGAYHGERLWLPCFFAPGCALGMGVNASTKVSRTMVRRLSAHLMLSLSPKCHTCPFQIRTVGLVNKPDLKMARNAGDFIG